MVGMPFDILAFEHRQLGQYGRISSLNETNIISQGTGKISM